MESIDVREKKSKVILGGLIVLFVSGMRKQSK